MKEIGFSLDGNQYTSDVITVENGGTNVLRIEVEGSSDVRLERSITGENWVNCGKIMNGISVFEANLKGMKVGQKLRLIFKKLDENNNIPQKIYLL